MSFQLLEKTIWIDPNMPIWCLKAIELLPFELLVDYREMFTYHFTDRRFYATLRHLAKQQ